ncbi:MAG: cysteine hydrolase family protein [Thermomicrobiales bacterium]
MSSAGQTNDAIPDWVSTWFADLRPVALPQIDPDPNRIALFSTDMLVGFCREGALSSDRVGALETPVSTLFETVWRYGVRHFVLTQDTHSPVTPEFEAWPVHCLDGTNESQTVPSLSDLPFSSAFTIFPKNSLSQSIGTGFDAWLDAHPHIETAIVVGNCSDLCVYQLAMHLRLRANAFDLSRYQVIVPANAVDTFDLSPDSAASINAFAHPGDFYHQVFLHHLALNGVRVVASIEER